MTSERERARGRKRSTHSLQVGKELFEIRPVIRVRRIASEHFLGQLLVYLIQDTLERCEPSTESSGLQHQVDFGY